MIIVPKYADEDRGPFIHDGVIEFQMLDRDLIRSVDTCRALTDATKVFYHLPFGMHNIFYYTHPNTKPLLEALLAHLRTDSEFIIAHAEIEPSTFYAFNGKELLDMCRGKLYLENSVAMPTSNNLMVDSAWQIASECNIPVVCDVTHLRATCFLYSIDQFIPKGCSYFHFSACLDGDGVVDKKRTHGRAHRCYEDAVSDINFLEAHGAYLDDALVCTEISEKDYATRPDMMREIEYLRRYLREK